MSCETVKQMVCYSCFKYWQMLQNVILHLYFHTLFHTARDIASYNMHARLPLSVHTPDRIVASSHGIL